MFSKGNLRNQKEQPQTVRIYLQNLYLKMDLCLEYMKHTYNSVIVRQTTKWAKYLNKHSYKLNIQIEIKYMRRSLVIRVMQIKITMR